MNDQTAGLGHNAPPLADQIALAYSTVQLADDHEALAKEVGELTSRAASLVMVGDAATNEQAGALVIELRALGQKVDAEAERIKEPVYRAYSTVLDFFNGLNRSDPKRPGPLTAHKMRLEKSIRDYGFMVAEEARQARLKAEAAERERAAKEAQAAAEAEAALRPAVAQVLIDQAVKSEAIANNHAAVAAGPVQELARSRTASAVTGLRAVPGFEITDREALRASLGPLGSSFTLDAVESAIRKHRVQSEQFGKWPFERDDDAHAQRRNVKPDVPVPGVTYFISYEGSVRA